MNKYKIASFYQFLDFFDYKESKKNIELLLLNKNITGTVLLASEGINATISGDSISLDKTLDSLMKIVNIDKLNIKFSYSLNRPFKRLRVKIKNEIVTMGISNAKPQKDTGTFVDPVEWNKIINDSSTIIIDTRNFYEVSIGSFANSLSPNTKTFREFPKWAKNNLDKSKNSKIAMFCTGGIRCEKASSYLKSIGFKDVFQLKGGILKYLEDIEKKDSLWKGECFVFDERVSVVHNLEEGNYNMCHACRMPINDSDMKNNKYIKGVSCSHCFNKTSDEDKKRFLDRQKQVELSKLNNTDHFASQKR
ncbi:MAG: hypothetical protein CFH01_01269 [Alphaproteobacteria bacterium MarineAlpha2_Bin1]|nr:MAG: hypothetical protein CFH01_01269 [Alphaproteobacteria bacterium MarineAlpha2_Bin1]